MTAAALPARPAVTARQTGQELGWLYAKRFARHPLFLLGIALCVWATGASINDANTSYLTLGLFVAAFIGLPSMVVAYRLTRMTDRAAEAADAAPTAVQTRTGAVLLSCLVPAAVGTVFLSIAWYGAETWPPPGWVFAGFSGGDVFAMFVGQMVVAPFGAAALGVAAGRWLRFPGAIVLLVVGVVSWVLLSLSLFALDDVEKVTSTGTNAVRLFSPFTTFAVQTEPGTPDQGQLAFPGSPVWYAGWLLVLCAFAITAALLWRAEGGTRRMLLLGGAVLVACAAATYVLALTVNSDGGGLYRMDGTIQLPAEQ